MSYDGGVAYPTAAIEEGVQAAIDAHELVFSLRSEVSALERHATTLQANLDRLETTSAVKVDQTAINSSWVAHTTAKKGGGAKAPAMTGNTDDNMAVEGAATSGATPTGAAGHKHRKIERAKRRKRAAAILQQTVGDDGGGTETAMPESAAQGEEARAVELAREARQTAQETLVSRRVAEA